MLTDAQIAEYREKGYVVPDYRLPEVQLQEIRDRHTALHDVDFAHGSEANRSPHPRRGMTMRMMPTTSVHDRDRATAMHAERGGLDMSHHSIFLLRGEDRSGHNDIRLRARSWNN
jgi:hypothetical protein